MKTGLLKDWVINKIHKPDISNIQFLPQSKQEKILAKLMKKYWKLIYKKK